MNFGNICQMISLLHWRLGECEKWSEAIFSAIKSASLSSGGIWFPLIGKIFVFDSKSKCAKNEASHQAGRIVPQTLSQRFKELRWRGSCWPQRRLIMLMMIMTKLWWCTTGEGDDTDADVDNVDDVDDVDDQHVTGEHVSEAISSEWESWLLDTYWLWRLVWPIYHWEG